MNIYIDSDLDRYRKIAREAYDETAMMNNILPRRVTTPFL